MKILITSIVDLKKGPHTRLHEFIRFLAPNHQITVLSINDWWKAGQTNTDLYMAGLDEGLGRIQLEYLTERRVSPMLQEITSALAVGRILERFQLETYDVHLNYNSLISGYFVSRRLRKAGVNTVYDLADDLPQMIRVSPQLPGPARPLGKLVGNTMLRKNLDFAVKVSYVDENIRDHYPVSQEKEVIIRNGVDAQLFSPREAKGLRNELGLEKAFVI
ncbi:MAG: hypothetical protein IBX68_11210, partial [Dehalococcoidia bacterium]|nr:hypothetical protein [Dehalococcoidia bacterium]